MIEPKRGLDAQSAASFVADSTPPMPCDDARADWSLETWRFEHPLQSPATCENGDGAETHAAQPVELHAENMMVRHSHSGSFSRVSRAA